jgi:cytochrome c-type biogenesis protein
MVDQLSLMANSWVMAGTALAAAGSFLWGMISAVSSPCHWVSLPIMVSYIAGQDRAFRVRCSIHYATAFIGGLLITLALAGITCSLPDLMLGESGIYLTIPAGAVLLLAAIDILGVTRYSASGSFLGRVKIKGLAGAFLLGLAYGVFSGSCTFVRQKILTEMLFFVFLVLGYSVPLVMARSSAARVKRLLGNNLFPEDETWFRKCAGVMIGLLGIYFILSPFFGTS